MRIQSLTAVRLFLGVAATVLFAIGCDKPTETAGGSSGTTSVAGDHDHDHSDHGHDHSDGDHDHEGHSHAAHGPQGGHMFPLESKEFLGEWTQSQSNDVIKFYLMDAAKQAKPVKVEYFHVIPMVGNDPTPFELEAESPDDEGKSAVYVLDDKNLHTALPLGVKIEFKTGDTVVTGKVDAHTPYDH